MALTPLEQQEQAGQVLLLAESATRYLLAAQGLLGFHRHNQVEGAEVPDHQVRAVQLLVLRPARLQRATEARAALACLPPTRKTAAVITVAVGRADFQATQRTEKVVTEHKAWWF